MAADTWVMDQRPAVGGDGTAGPSPVVSLTKPGGAAPPGDDRCGHCGARQESGITWCSQCYADRRPEPVPDVEAQARPEPAAGSVQPARGAPARGAPARAELDREELDRVSGEMLARLAAEAAPRGGSGRLVDVGLRGAGAKTLAVVLGTIVVALVGFALMFVAGTLL